MKLKYIIPSVLVIVAAGILAFNSYSNSPEYQDINTNSRKAVIASVMTNVIEHFHYSPKDINDAFSKKVFKKYIKKLDGKKNFFFQSDIDYLKKYETLIDEELKGLEPLLFYKEADSIISVRIDTVETLYSDILSTPFSFTKEDSLQRDRGKLDFPKNKAERKSVWTELLKFRTMKKLLDLKKTRSKAVDTASIKSKSDEDLEAEARKDIKQSLDLYFDRMASHYNGDARFEEFLNTVTWLMDPHSNYFSPKSHRYFDEQMSGTFYGIGALLSQ